MDMIPVQAKNVRCHCCIIEHILRSYMHLSMTSHLKNRAYWSWLDNWTSAGLVLVTYAAWGGWCAYARNGGGQAGWAAGMSSFGVFTAVVATSAMHRAHVMAVEGRNGSRRATISVGLNESDSDGL